MASSPRVEELRKKFDENPRRYFAPLANEYRKAGDFAQAIAICREYLPQQPGHMSGHIVFGQALYEARQFDEAKTVFETALSLDPENLIALKHLGDIELIAGKTESARAWYQKILDADPRNEEILAQLAKLEEKAKGAKIGATMVMQAVPRPGTAPKAPAAPKPPPTPAAAAPAPPITADSATQEIRLDTIPTHAPPPAAGQVEPALGLEPTSMGGSVEPQSFSTAPTIEIDTPVSSQKEAPLAGSFSLEGLETTSLTSESEPAAAPPPATSPPADIDAPAEGLVDLDISIPAVAPEAAPSLATAAPVEAETVALDFAPPPAMPAAPSPVAEAIDLDFAPPSMTPSAPAVEVSASGNDLPSIDMQSAESEAVPQPEPEEAVATPAMRSGAFDTETMAELYLKQGHREEALRVYRALLEKRPGDPGLIARIASLQPASVPRTGPTIREMLHVIALRRPGYRPAAPSNGNAAAAHAIGADGLAHLFDGAPVSPEDDAAAWALSAAFIEHNGQDSILTGAPARQASDELSLNSVFSADNPAPAPAPTSFSFDQFFSQRATAEHETLLGGSEQAESKEDVAQFSQWLEGLKQK